MKMETYGKANILMRGYQAVKNRFVIGEQTKRILGSIEAYIPKITAKEKIGAIGIIICILTPATNWMIPFIGGWALR